MWIFKKLQHFLLGYIKKTSGGLLVCVSENFDCDIIPQLTTILPFKQIVTRNFMFFIKKIVSSLYRPPKAANFEILNTFIGDPFASEILESSDNIFCGDFNLNLMNMTEAPNNSLVFHHNMQTLALLTVIWKPTRISASLCSLIDNIFVNNLVNFLPNNLILK